MTVDEAKEKIIKKFKEVLDKENINYNEKNLSDLIIINSKGNYS